MHLSARAILFPWNVFGQYILNEETYLLFAIFIQTLFSFEFFFGFIFMNWFIYLGIECVINFDIY